MSMIRRTPGASRRRLRPAIETLEGRSLMSVSAAAPHAAIHPITSPHLVHLHPMATHSAHGGAPTGVVTPLHHRINKFLGGPATSALTPSQIKTAYEFPKIANGGAGQTIAIVDAYDDPNILADLTTFSRQFNLPLPNTAGGPKFTVAYSGGSRPAANGGWAQEISLDVEWAHAIAPYANIILVEASSATDTALLAGVDYATNHGANVVSMSWGASEFAQETSTSYDSHFTHAVVTYVAAAGDGGVQTWPAVSTHVVAAGGTTLHLNANNTWQSETGWNAYGGGGVSTYLPKPGFQSRLPYTKRATPDVSYDSDPNTGFAVYDSFRYAGQSGWLQIGGTSAAAPQWAALIALADQQRGSLGSLSSSQTLAALYGLTTGTKGTEQLHDISGGRNKAGTAGPGYDLLTGLGSPHAGRVIAALASA
jgi:subtilase family serine protease